MRKKTPTNPKPLQIHFQAVIQFYWKCARCGKQNFSQRAANSPVLAAKCGHCHYWTEMDYEPTMLDRQTIRSLRKQANLRNHAQLN